MTTIYHTRKNGNFKLRQSLGSLLQLYAQSVLLT